MPPLVNQGLGCDSRVEKWRQGNAAGVVEGNTSDERSPRELDSLTSGQQLDPFVLKVIGQGDPVLRLLVIEHQGKQPIP